MNDSPGGYPESLRDPLPPVESYPLMRSEVDAALVSKGVERVDLIYFLRGRQRWTGDSGRVIDARFRAANEYSERLELRVFAVPVRLKAAVSSAFRDGMLGEVARWLSLPADADGPWRSMDHALLVRWDKDKLLREELDGLAARAH